MLTEHEFICTLHGLMHQKEIIRIQKKMNPENDYTQELEIINGAIDKISGLELVPEEDNDNDQS